MPRATDQRRWPVRTPVFFLPALLISASLAPLQSEAAESKNPAGKPPAPKPSLNVSLEDDVGTGVVQFGEELPLAVTLADGPKSATSLVAVVESLAFDKAMVPMEQTETPGEWKAAMTIQPKPVGYTSVRPKAVRLRVTISRVRDNALKRVLARTIYLTMVHEPTKPQEKDSEEEASEAPVNEMPLDEVQPDVPPVANVLIAEEDLRPLPETKRERLYWKEITRLISRSWSYRMRFARGVNEARETVRVRFRMHANGNAQLIQLERSSGVREVDEAGLLAIVQAHPFPPIPGGINEQYVDVHVRMRTGARPAAVVPLTSQAPAPVGTIAPEARGPATVPDPKGDQKSAEITGVESKEPKPVESKPVTK
ncbi:MAG: energy transducer TonB [Nitrospiraceae bacterium]